MELKTFGRILQQSLFILIAVAMNLMAASAANAYDLRLSLSPDRSGAVALDGQTVSGDIYVFTGPDSGVKRVLFYLDDPSMTGSPIQTEGKVPYDFAGTAQNGTAKPYSTVALSDGSHSITAKIELSAGGSEVIEATFTVDNPAVSLPISDNFNDGDASGWTVVDDSNEGPSDWTVVNGKYHQRNFVGFFRSALDQSYHLGTFSYLDASLNLADYQFNVKATPLSEAGHEIGVMFRFSDVNNYYRLSFSASDGFTRLEKKVNGAFTTLAKNARGFTKGVPLNITIEAKGKLFQIMVNGDKLFSVYDSNLSSGGIALYCREDCAFDDVSLLENSTAPSVVISKPEAHTVSPSGTIQATAVVLNKPANSTVEFTLGGASCDPAVETNPGLFKAQCSAPLGTYQLTAELVQGSAVIDTDVNQGIGIQGDSYVAIGDSITWGLGDNFATDNLVSGGWLIATQGYEAPLNTLLNNGESFSNIVFNDGVPGDRSSTVLNIRVDSVLERHPESNFILILIGTNDASGSMPTPSGLGCSGSACNGTFKDNMQRLVNKVNAAGKIPIVSLVPPRFGATSNSVPYSDPLNESRNQLIQDYNAVINTELTDHQVGPNLFDFFLGSGVNRFSLFDDNLHPNGLGYKVKAELWQQALLGSGTLSFILDDICVRPTGGACDNPLLYKQNLIEPGDKYYVDENYTVTSIPSELTGGRWIMTENSDKAVTAANYLEFSFTGTAAVYIAYDDDVSSIPTWLSSFTDTGLFIQTTNPSASAMRLYRLDNASGAVTLGGNLADGASGTPENYVVIVVKN